MVEFMKLNIYVILKILNQTIHILHNIDVINTLLL